MQWQPDQWRAWEHRSKCRLFNLPGLSACSVAVDWMHAKYLGNDQYVFGSLLYVLCFVVMTETPLENLQRCWNFIKRYYVRFNVEYRYQCLNKLSMFCRKSGFPKLRGKAAEIKGIGPALLALWEKHMRPAVTVHRQILMMMQANVNAERILAEHSDSLRLPAGPANRFQEHVFLMCQLQGQLAEYFLDETNLKVFNRTSKLHGVCHCALLCEFLHPRMTWCFRGEDMMSKTQSIAKSSVRGNNAANAINKMAKRYKLGLHLQFKACSI